MPVSKSLGKIQKANKNKPVHPKGRKFKQINRATLRELSILKKKLQHVEKKTHELMIVKFIQDMINSPGYSERESFALSDMQEFLELYINRDDDELENLKNARKPGRPTSNKQLLLENRKKQELNMFETGWYVPNLLNLNAVKNLRNWNGTFGGSNNVEKILVKKGDDKQVITMDTKMVEA